MFTVNLECIYSAGGHIVNFNPHLNVIYKVGNAGVVRKDSCTVVGRLYFFNLVEKYGGGGMVQLINPHNGCAVFLETAAEYFTCF